MADGGAVDGEHAAKPVAREASGNEGGAAADAASGKTVAGTGYVLAACHLCKASELAALPVHAGTERFGKVENLIVDLQQRHVVAAVVGHGATLGVGGTEYLIPFAGLVACNDGTEGSAEVAMLCAADKGTDDLARCVTYEPREDGGVDAALVERALATDPMRAKN